MGILIHDDYIVGENQITDNTGLFAAGQTIDKRTPIARLTATGELKKWSPAASDGTQLGIGLTVFAVDSQAGALAAAFHDGGCFNGDMINWPADATAEQKIGCFDRTPISTQKLG